MPPLDGATAWINSAPLDPAGLRGQVVLVDFWTLTCINWLRTEPYVRAWARAYRDDGLVVIGVHTPEFSFEHEIDLVRQATTQHGIRRASRAVSRGTRADPLPRAPRRRGAGPVTRRGRRRGRERRAPGGPLRLYEPLKR